MDKKRHSLIPVGRVLAFGASAAVAVFTLILHEQLFINQIWKYKVCLILLRVPLLNMII